MELSPIFEASGYAPSLDMFQLPTLPPVRARDACEENKGVSSEDESGWTPNKELCLNLLKNLNRGAIRVNPDELESMLGEKMRAALTDGGSLNEAGDDTVPMKIWFQTMTPEMSHFVVHITKSTQGKDLYDILEMYGFSQQYYEVKWHRSASTLALFDTLFSYYTQDVKFELRPKFLGGGKTVAKKELKQSVKLAESNAIRKAFKSKAESINLNVPDMTAHMTDLSNVIGKAVQLADTSAKDAFEYLLNQCKSVEFLQDAMDTLDRKKSKSHGVDTRVHRFATPILGEKMKELLAYKKNIDLCVDGCGSAIHFIYLKMCAEDATFDIGKLQQMVDKRKEFIAGQNSQTSAVEDTADALAEMRVE